MPSAQEIWMGFVMPRGQLLHGAHKSNNLSSPTLLSPPQDNPPGQLEEFPPPGNISLISLGIPPLSHEALYQPNKAPQAVEENQPGPCLFPTKAAKLNLF